MRRSNRTGAKTFAGITALLGLGVGAFLGGCSQPEDPPLEGLAALGEKGRASGYNVLLVTLDTVRADHLGCYGFETALTPVIDSLAASGLRFAQVMAPTPVTLPSHTSILTGRQVPDHGIRNNAMYRLNDEDHVTLAERLRDDGYRTAAFVGSYVLDSRFGLDQGFEVYDDEIVPDPVLERANHYDQRRADTVTRSALDWFEGLAGEDDGKPFFAWVHYFDAHHPYIQPEWLQDRPDIHPYDGEIAFVDGQFGRLLKRLEELGLRERTLIIVTADHGEGLGEHGEPTHSRLIYDSTMLVPLILNCPELFPEPEVVEDRLASLCDIYPTVLDLLGVPYEAAEGSLNLLTSIPDPERAIYIETLVPLLNDGGASLHGLRRMADKFILAGPPEYYDLATDPKELTNLYGSSTEAEALESFLHDRMTNWPPVKGAEAIEITQEERERLASLGYVNVGQRPLGAELLDPRRMIESLENSARILALSDEGRNEEALIEIERWLRKNPKDAQAWDTAATINERLGELNQAAAAIYQGIRAAPTAERYVRLSLCYVDQGDLEKAVKSVERARALDPDQVGIFLAWGRILSGSGKFAEAMQAFEQALERNPDDSATIEPLLEEAQSEL